MSSDQDALIHEVVTAADGEESNFVFVIRKALDEVEAQGQRQGYADCLKDQYHAKWLAEQREKRAATEAAGQGEQR